MRQHLDELIADLDRRIAALEAEIAAALKESVWAESLACLTQRAGDRPGHRVLAAGRHAELRPLRRPGAPSRPTPGWPRCRASRGAASAAGRRIGHDGNGRLRTALYMATLSAARYNPAIKAFYQRLRAAGKPMKVVVSDFRRRGWRHWPSSGSVARLTRSAEESMPCPHCAVTTTAEQPKRTALGYRTFRCAHCRRTFNERTGTPFNQLQVPTDIVLLVVLWRLRYKLSLRDLAEMFLERGFVFTHETVRDWEARFAPLLTARLRAKRRGTGREQVARRRDLCQGQRAPGATSTARSIGRGTSSTPC